MKMILHEEHSESSTALSKVLETLDELLITALFFSSPLASLFGLPLTSSKYVQSRMC